jgi:hypothetical protein
MVRCARGHEKAVGDRRWRTFGESLAMDDHGLVAPVRQ